MDQKVVFTQLLEQGHPLFLAFPDAAILLGAPSEDALRAAFRRGKCPVRVTRNAVGRQGFALTDIAEFLVTRVPQSQPLRVSAPKRRGAPSKRERVERQAMEQNHG